MISRALPFAALLAAATLVAPALAQQPPGQGTVLPKFSQPIPNIPGKSFVAAVVNYAPGEASPPHRHAPSAFVYAYVLSGAVRSQVDDQPVRVYKAGESWYETPGAHHRVSENASKTEPASLLAILVVDSGDTPLTTPDPR
jgi:quercetin dioxygenase-like cupin family protein